MDGITWSDLLRLFCCPPRPSRIVAKLAFMPPVSTYNIRSEHGASSGHILLKEEIEWMFADSLLKKIDAFWCVSSEQSRIACVYIPTDKLTPSNYTLFFSHGNAVDLGEMINFLQDMSRGFNVNVLCYDYSGYGESGGQPLESNMYADAEAAFTELRERYKCPLERIVLYGQSIGTAPTVELARRYKTAGVVLHSPLMSGLRVVCPGTSRSHCFDPFTNIDKIAEIESPTLIIHGTEDTIINISHGEELYNRLSVPVEPLWVARAGHNDIETFPEYSDRLKKFLNIDLAKEANRNATVVTQINPGSGDRL